MQLELSCCSELMRNHTLRFLSRTLPVLRADDTLPRVAHVPPPRAAHGTHGTHDTHDTHGSHAAHDTNRYI